MSTAKPLANDLAGEKSPFLKHGAKQPVAWMPWGDAAFDRARSTDRPILLDIGAVWCHWCHVMDRESYEDADTAALINDLFVPVKVDRDERPDVDARYQRAVQLLTGQGGWPLTAFLTPDGEVFYGGTYFPPVAAHGRPSFTHVLNEVERVWREERPRALEAASRIGERLEAAAGAEARAGEPTDTLLTETLEELAHSFDFRHGGFGRAPKFPNAGALDLLLDEHLDTAAPWPLRIVEETLDAMIAGGFHDQIGGGFHRYSTDARWLIPHFEKMAYDNGVLLATCARAFAGLGVPWYRAAAEDVVAHYQDIAGDMLREGGFPASQDADHSPDDDGDYWTWTREEVARALGDEELERTALLYYGFDDPGGEMHLDRSRHVLFRAFSTDVLAERLGLPIAQTEERVRRIRTLLKEARDARPAPYIDTTLYSGWSALVASGFFAAERFAGVTGASKPALCALERIMREGFTTDVGVLHRVGDDSAGVHVDDQAHVLLALIDAFEFTQDPVWLDHATAVARVMHARFRDPAAGALRDRPLDARGAVQALDRPYFPIADAPSPSGNGAAALGLLRLHAYTGDVEARDDGRAILRAFAGSASQLGSSAATWMKALAWETRPVTTVVVVEQEEDGPMWRSARRAIHPRTVIRRLNPAEPDAEGDAADRAALPPELAAMITGDVPRGYVCSGQTCAVPARNAAELTARMHEFRG
ncbi:MAG: thioredoxin domain-containing protein [Gemmatimonadetes bacterium]|nr:thioredoxin domain-containing protein [Gemmatimonadota bacterium]